MGGCNECFVASPCSFECPNLGFAERCEITYELLWLCTCEPSFEWELIYSYDYLIPLTWIASGFISIWIRETHVKIFYFYM